MVFTRLQYFKTLTVKLYNVHSFIYFLKTNNRVVNNNFHFFKLKSLNAFKLIKNQPNYTTGCTNMLSSYYEISRMTMKLFYWSYIINRKIIFSTILHPNFLKITSFYIKLNPEFVVNLHFWYLKYWRKTSSIF